jgi:hypothetical protein
MMTGVAQWGDTHWRPFECVERDTRVHVRVGAGASGTGTAHTNAHAPGTAHTHIVHRAWGRERQWWHTPAATGTHPQTHAYTHTHMNMYMVLAVVVLAVMVAVAVLVGRFARLAGAGATGVESVVEAELFARATGATVVEAAGRAPGAGVVGMVLAVVSMAEEVVATAVPPVLMGPVVLLPPPPLCTSASGAAFLRLNRAGTRGGVDWAVVAVMVGDVQHNWCCPPVVGYLGWRGRRAEEHSSWHAALVEHVGCCPCGLS